MAEPANVRGRSLNTVPSWPPLCCAAPRAVAMSVYVVRAFVQMRDALATNATILKRLAEIDKKLVTHDVILRDVYEKLRPLMAPPPEPPRKEMGFHTRQKKT